MASHAESDSTNLRFIFLIVAVATLGGFMFGYDSGAINGTTEGSGTAFNLDELSLGLVATSLLPGAALGAFMAGRLADISGSKTRDDYRAVSVHCQRVVLWRRLKCDDVCHRPLCGRGCGRCGFGAVARLYFGSDPSAFARAAIQRSTDNDRGWSFRCGIIQSVAPKCGGFFNR